MAKLLDGTRIYGSSTIDTTLLVSGGIQLGAGTSILAPVQLTSGTLLATTATGAVEYDGNNIYATVDLTSGRGSVPVTQTYRLTSAGATISTIANYFGSTSTNITLVPNASYEIEIILYYLKTTAGTVTWTLTNSAAPTNQNIYYEMSPVTGIVAPPGTASTMLAGQAINQTAAYSFTSASLTTGVNHYAKFVIWLANGAGTSLKIQATCSAGTITPGIGSIWYCKRLPTGNVATYAA
jgi:hypothetical protein